MNRFVPWAAFLALALGIAPARAQDDSGIFDESEIEDQVQDAIEQASEDIASDLDVDSLGDTDLGSLDAGDLSSEVDVTNDFDPADAAVNLELQSDTGRAVRRGSARDPNRRAMELLFSQSSKKRAAGARALGNLNATGSVSPLVIALGDKEPAVRKAATDALAKVGDLDALGSLKRAMAREKDPKLARAMDKAIGAIENRVFTGPGAGEPVTLACSDGRKFVLLRKVPRGFCPYDGTAWTLKK